MRRRLILLLLLALAGTALLEGQSLSQQVLQLLTRTNTWTALQTFNAAISFPNAIPSTTTLKLYSDGTNLFWNGSALSGGGSVTTPHNILSTTHPDTTAATVVRGDLMTGQAASPLWKRLALGTTGMVLRSDGTDAVWSFDGSLLTSLNAAQLTGTIAAISGANLTSLNATQLTSGTVPLARLVAITNTEISASAAIVRSKLSLAAGIVLTTDVTGILPVANGGTNLATSAEDNVMVGNGITWEAKAVPDCDATTSALNYDVTTNAFSCRTLSLGTGTVTSVALSLPAIFTVSGSPVTTTGTLTGTLASQLQNLLWASPNGSSGAPTFRAIVNADLPTTGVGAGTYSSVTVNTAGVVTAGSANQSLATVTGTLGIANGGTGLTAIGDDNLFLGSAATTVAAAAVPNCVAASCWGIGYTTATNTFAAITARTITMPQWLDTGYCQNATAVLAWSTPTTNPGVAACVTGSNTQKLVIDFADGANTLSVQRELKLPSDWTSTVDATFTWYTTATTGDVVWQLSTICVANAETGDPAFNTASTVTDTAQGTTNQYNVATITGVTVTGCAAGETLYLRVFRDPTNGSDTLAATARLVGVELILRRSL
jgi:hypothetical protein